MLDQLQHITGFTAFGQHCSNGQLLTETNLGGCYKTSKSLQPMDLCLCLLTALSISRLDWQLCVCVVFIRQPDL